MAELAIVVETDNCCDGFATEKEPLKITANARLVEHRPRSKNFLYASCPFPHRKLTVLNCGYCLAAAPGFILAVIKKVGCCCCLLLLTNIIVRAVSFFILVMKTYLPSGC